MKITEITMSTSRVIPHPRESYANLRPMLSLRASVDETEDITAAVGTLQAQADVLLASHVAHLELDIEAEYQAKRKRQEEAYGQRQRERLAASAGGDADALDDDEIEDNEDITSDDVDAMDDEDDDETPFET